MTDTRNDNAAAPVTATIPRFDSSREAADALCGRYNPGFVSDEEYAAEDRKYGPFRVTVFGETTEFAALEAALNYASHADHTRAAGFAQVHDRAGTLVWGRER